jgi:hypothetical protein
VDAAAARDVLKKWPRWTDALHVLRILIPAVVMIAGISGTISGYMRASPGGQYTIWWGAIIFGGLRLVWALADR